MARGIEELCEKKIENRMRGFRMKTANPKDSQHDMDFHFKKLSETNDALADDLKAKFDNARERALNIRKNDRRSV